MLFSGTLTPPAFYRDLLGLPPETGWVDVGSPFHGGQLAVQRWGTCPPALPTGRSRWPHRPPDG